MRLRGRLPLLAFGALAVFLAAAAYISIAFAQYRVNGSLSTSDQGAYMNFAKRAYQSSFHYTGGRNRMPLYPWLQALFYHPELDDEAFFKQGKKVNFALSVICLAVIGAAFAKRFRLSYALYATAVIALLLFAIKAPFFQVEALYYTLFGLAFMLSCDSLRSPSWRKSLGLGALYAAAHFAKASALPGLMIYAAFMLIMASLRFLRGTASLQESLRGALHAAVSVLVFFALLFPYFNESKERYGQYLYNVNTTFYMWYDSWDDAKAGTRAAGDRHGWPDMPQDEIPSLSKYFAEHSPDEIAARVIRSFRSLFETACLDRGSVYNTGICLHVAFGLGVSAFGTAALLVACLATSRCNGWELPFFALAFLAFYFLSALWYWQIVNGPRIMLPLALPVFWIGGHVLRRDEVRAIGITAAGERRIALVDLLVMAMTVLLLCQVVELVAFRAARLYGGN